MPRDLAGARARSRLRLPVVDCSALRSSLGGSSAAPSSHLPVPARPDERRVAALRRAACSTACHAAPAKMPVARRAARPAARASISLRGPRPRRRRSGSGGQHAVGDAQQVEKPRGDVAHEDVLGRVLARARRARSRSGRAGRPYISENEARAFMLVPSPEFCMSTAGRAPRARRRRPGRPPRPRARPPRRAAADARSSAPMRSSISEQGTPAKKSKPAPRAGGRSRAPVTTTLISAQARW